ncbi:MAG: LacI family transcriptional regulator [Phycisphaerae bacterium]|nr:LacI family transcriptional regulator [Phycisphaerae bacterium]
MRITLKDIASEVGTDPATVSRVLNDKGRQAGISQKRAAKILKAAQKLRYIPNSSARAIRTGRFDCATLLLSTHRTCSYLPTLLLEGMHDELAKQDMHLTLAKLPDEQLSSEGYVPKILRYMMSDGLLIDYTHQLPAKLESMIQRHKIPAVWINTKRETNCVYPDNLAAGRRATEHLLNLGHRRIAYVDYITGRDGIAEAHYSATDRCRGYEQAMRSVGLEPRTIRPDKGRVPGGEEVAFTKNWLDAPDRPTAVVVYWIASAMPVLHAALASGLRVPEDLSMVTFNSESFGSDVIRESGLYISAMIEPERRMGREAVRMLIKKLDKSTIDMPSKSLSFALEELGTCCPPGGKEH